MSMYADYLREKTDDMIIETKEGFATYRFTSLKNEPAVYIIDLYVLPDFRKQTVASILADAIVKEGNKVGCKFLMGSVVPSNKSSTDSVKVLLAYGMTLDSATNNFILFKKEI